MMAHNEFSSRKHLCDSILVIFLHLQTPPSPPTHEIPRGGVGQSVKSGTFPPHCIELFPDPKFNLHLPVTICQWSSDLLYCCKLTEQKKDIRNGILYF